MLCTLICVAKRWNSADCGRSDPDRAGP
jgi:hypothetical protein